MLHLLIYMHDMIEIKDLTKTFGEKVAVNISRLSVEKNTILGIVGNNGAGKTTLFRLALDLLKADKGEVDLTFDNPDGTTFSTDVRVDEEWKKHVGAYIDSSFLIDFLSPEEYFEFIAKVSGISKNELDKRLEDFAPLMNGEIIGQKKLIRSMSAGNKQKIGIISALLHRPQLVILDEPFNFLDPSSQNQLKKFLVDYNRSTGATILVSSHNLSHTVDISQRIVVMEHGEIVKDLDNRSQGAKAELEEYFDK